MLNGYMRMMRLRRDLNRLLCSNHNRNDENRRNGMSVNAHVDQLKKKHQSLSEAVEQAQRAPGTDDLAIADLKKQKLRLKEEISRLSS
jgi:hypothetical protein